MRSLKTKTKCRGRPQKPRVYRLDCYTLHQEAPPSGKIPGKWKVSGRSSNGCYRRIRFDAYGFDEAKRKADDILTLHTPEAPDLTVAEAFTRMIKDRMIKSETRFHYRQFASYFCTWVEQERGIIHWKQLSYEVIHDYLSHLIAQGRASKTISHYLEPIRYTARLMTQLWPERYANFCAELRIPSDTRQVEFLSFFFS